MNHVSQLTTREAASRLDAHPRTVARMVERGEIKPIARLDLGHHGAYVFDPDEVERVRRLRAKKAEAQK